VKAVPKAIRREGVIVSVHSGRLPRTVAVEIGREKCGSFDIDTVAAASSVVVFKGGAVRICFAFISQTTICAMRIGNGSSGTARQVLYESADLIERRVRSKGFINEMRTAAGGAQGDAATRCRFHRGRPLKPNDQSETN